MIGCTCGVCRSTDPRDKRLRPSIYVDVPDARKAARRHHARSSAAGARPRLTRVDAMLFTHSHADHILGLDEIRRFNAIQGGADSRAMRTRDLGHICVRRSTTSSTA